MKINLKKPLAPVLIFSLLVVVGMLIGIAIEAGQEKNAEKDVFSINTVEQLERLDIREEIDGVYRRKEAKALGYTGLAEYKKDDNKVGTVCFTTVLSEKEQDPMTEKESVINAFTDEFFKYVKSETIPNPAVVQFTSDEFYANKPDNELDALWDGFVRYEYSCRDENGVLWIAEIYSPKEDMLCGSVTKFYSEKGFEGYIPQVNLERKESE